MSLILSVNNIKCFAGVAGTVTAKAGLITIHYAARTTTATATVFSPFAGIGAGLYAAHKSATIDNTSANHLVLGTTIAVPLAVSALNYGLARAEIAWRSRHGATEKQLRQSNEFHTIVTTGGLAWAALMTSELAGLVLGAPSNAVAAIGVGFFSAMAGFGTSAYFGNAFFEKHFDCVADRSVRKAAAMLNTTLPTPR